MSEQTPVPASWASNATTRASMMANRRRDTKPELAVRRLLHASGLRYRVDYAPLTTRPRNRADIVFTRAQVVVFIDGCFWHGCNAHYVPAKRNGEYWAEKIATNRQRDMKVNGQLVAAGWTVLRFWEHEPAIEVAKTISAVIRSRS